MIELFQESENDLPLFEEIEIKSNAFFTMTYFNQKTIFLYNINLKELHEHNGIYFKSN